MFVPAKMGLSPLKRRRKSGGWHWLRQWCAIRASSPVRRIANPSYPVVRDPGDAIRGLFDCVLVDEYQDTNTLQADILYALSPQGRGLTAVGDDAQSIYSFRAATVRNILDFPKHYADATIVTLEQNYRSSQPILEATNQVISLAQERYHQEPLVRSAPRGSGRSWSVARTRSTRRSTSSAGSCEHREAGIDLRRQAVLFRASHHSIAAGDRVGAGQHPVPQVRRAEVHRDGPRQGPAGLSPARRKSARRGGRRPAAAAAAGHRTGQGAAVDGDVGRRRPRFEPWADWRRRRPPPWLWPKFVALIDELTDTSDELPVQLNRVRKFYAPLLEAKYDHPEPRLRDLEQLELIASRYQSRQRMLLEMTLDPPSSTQDFAGPPRAGRRLPGAEHDPFGQGAGVGGGVRDPRRRRQHPLRHGHPRTPRKSRRSGGCSTWP